MTDHFSHMGLDELADLVQKAERALADKKKSERKNVIQQIKELADSIGVTVTIHEPGEKSVSSRKGSKVPAKYKNPADPEQTWTGRGVKPVWLRDLLSKGRRIEDFLI